MAANLHNKYPVPAFFFEVDIDGTAISFQEVSGLEENAEVLEYRHGKSQSLITQKRAGLMKSSTITLKRGIFQRETDLTEMLKKLQDKKFQSGEAELPTLAIKLQVQVMEVDGNNKKVSVEKQVIMQWSILKPIPIKWSGPGLKSDSNEVSIESMEFAHQGLEITYPES